MKSREANQQDWKGQGKVYRELMARFTSPCHIEPIQRMIIPHIESPLVKQRESPVRILLLAMGSGAELDTLLEYCSAMDQPEQKVAIVGTDLSKDMLDEAREVVEKHSASSYVFLQAADAQDLSFSDASFDIVTLFYGPHMLPKADEAFKHIHRVLVPGGLAVNSTPAGNTTWDLLEAGKELLVSQRSVNGGVTTAEVRETKHLFKDAPLLKPWIDLDWQSSLKTVGFTDVQARFMQIDQLDKDVGEVVKALCNFGPMQSLYANHLTPDELTRYEQETMAIAAQGTNNDGTFLFGFRSAVVWGLKGS